jgi:multimeric flavodoxin WrbA
MKVVAVNGSGRTDGNTAVLANAVLRGAAENEAETMLLQLGEMDLAGCNACEACKKTRKCVINDDMGRFYDIAPESDVLVLASPIYLDHVTAQMKAFLDRLYCYIGPEMEKLYPNPGARAVIGITYGAGGRHVYDSVLDWIAERLRAYWGIDVVGSFAVNRASAERLIDADHPAVRAAYDLGKGLT